MRSDGSIRRVWGFFFPPSKLPLCRRNTAPNKLFNPIISPSPALFPDIFHCSQSEVCFGTCHREWQAVWMCFLPTFPWNSLVNKPYSRCFFFFLFFFFPPSLTWRENKRWHQHMRHGRLQLLQTGEHSRCTDWARGRRLKTKTFDILRDSRLFVFWGAGGVSREREALPRPSDVNQGKGLDTDALPPLLLLLLLPPSLLPSSFGLNCLSLILSLSVGRELSFYTCTFLSNIRGALSSRQSVCTTHTWTNMDTKKEPKAGENSCVEDWHVRKLFCWAVHSLFRNLTQDFIWSPVAKNFQDSQTSYQRVGQEVSNRYDPITTWISIIVISH